MAVTPLALGVDHPWLPVTTILLPMVTARPAVVLLFASVVAAP